MTGRDRIAVGALGVGALLAVPTWHWLGPWGALALLLVAIATACVAYRIEPPRIDVEHPETWPLRAAERAEVQQPVDQ